MVKQSCTAVLATLIFSTGAICQNPPAPSIDRVGFPADYKNWTVMYIFDRPDNKSVRTVYANEQGLTIDNLGQYPYGAIIAMETWRSLQDAAGTPILDERGRFQKDPAATPNLFVMRKERGFGVDYGENRNGEWEYVAYRPDGTFQTAPQNSFACAVCHLQAGQSKDWVFRGGLHFNNASGSVPYGTIQHYRFVPDLLSAKADGTITIYNDDVIEHTFADVGDSTWGPIHIKPGSSITITFPNQTGEFNFRCTLHANMRGKVIVE